MEYADKQSINILPCFSFNDVSKRLRDKPRRLLGLESELPLAPLEQQRHRRILLVVPSSAGKPAADVAVSIVEQAL